MSIERRGVVIACGASVLLNVFLVGIIAGHYFSARGGRPQGPPGVGGVIQPGHVKALSPEERRIFGTAMAAHRPTIRAAREVNRARRQAVVADIAAAVFDRDKVTADLHALRQANFGVSEAVDAGLVDALAGLPARARADLVAHQPTGGPPPDRP